MYLNTIFFAFGFRIFQSFTYTVHKIPMDLIRGSPFRIAWILVVYGPIGISSVPSNYLNVCKKLIKKTVKCLLYLTLWYHTYDYNLEKQNQHFQGSWQITYLMLPRFSMSLGQTFVTVYAISGCVLQQRVNLLSDCLPGRGTATWRTCDTVIRIFVMSPRHDHFFGPWTPSSVHYSVEKCL